MRFSFFVLAATIAFIVCCDVVSSSSAVKSSTSKTASSHLVSSTGAALESSRLLRTSEAGHRSSNDEERANAYYEKLLEFLAKLTGKKAPVDLTRKFPSPPKADKLTRSKSFPDEKAASPKLTRSQTYSTETVDWDGAIKATGNVKASLKVDVKRRFTLWDRRNLDPDAVFTHFQLDPNLSKTTKVDKNKLLEAAKGSDERYGEYVLWYKYNKWYKEEHPQWISSIGKEKLD